MAKMNGNTNACFISSIDVKCVERIAIPDADFPLIPAKVEFVIENAGTHVASGLMRAIMGEISSCCLEMDVETIEWCDTSDKFLIDAYIQRQIACVPLRSRIDDETIANVRFDINVVNDSTEYRMILLSDLIPVGGADILKKHPIFNPSFAIGTIDARTTLRVKNIVIKKGSPWGGSHVFSCGKRGYCRPLDVEEYDVKDTHHVGGSQISRSGFKESTLTSNPRKHLVGFTLAAVPRADATFLAKAVVVDACTNIVGRLRRLREDIKNDVDNLNIIKLGDGLYEAQLRNYRETHTIGNIVVEYIKEIKSHWTLMHADYSYVEHSSDMEMNVRVMANEPDSATEAMIEGIDAAIAAISSASKSMQ
jgi:DNA-directed RNA polymerase subunit L